MKHAELRVVREYNVNIQLPRELRDNGTREMLDEILKAGEGYGDYIEAQLEQIKQVGLQTYLGEQVC